MEAKLQLAPLGIDLARRKLDIGKRLATEYAAGEWIARQAMLADMDDDGADEKRLASALALGGSGCRLAL